MHLLYATKGSGNCYKVQLLMRQLAIPFRIVNIDVLAGQQRSPEYLSINPNGKVPYLLLSNGRALGESNAMLAYLAEGSHLMPQDPFQRARVFEWLFWEQSSHEPFISPARFWIAIMPQGRAERAQQIAQWQERGNQALAFMDAHLARHDYLAGDAYTIADIGLYGYTCVAHEGEFDMTKYPHVSAWMQRVAGSADYVPMMEFAEAA